MKHPPRYKLSKKFTTRTLLVFFVVALLLYIGVAALDQKDAASTITDDPQVNIDIAYQAQQYIGASTASILPSDPRHACATFVSDVLYDTNLINYHEANVLNLYNHIRRDPNLDVAEIIPRASTFTTQNLAPLLPGDIIFYLDPTHTMGNKNGFTHVGIYVGNGKLVDTSSDLRHVYKRYVYGTSYYKYFTVLRIKGATGSYPDFTGAKTLFGVQVARAVSGSPTYSGPNNPVTTSEYSCQPVSITAGNPGGLTSKQLSGAPTGYLDVQLTATDLVNKNCAPLSWIPTVLNPAGVTAIFATSSTFGTSEVISSIDLPYLATKQFYARVPHNLVNSSITFSLGLAKCIPAVTINVDQTSLSSFDTGTQPLFVASVSGGSGSHQVSFWSQKNDGTIAEIGQAVATQVDSDYVYMYEMDDPLPAGDYQVFARDETANVNSLVFHYVVSQLVIPKI